MEYNIGDILELKSGSRAEVIEVDPHDLESPVRTRLEGDGSVMWIHADWISMVVRRGPSQLNRIEAKLDELRKHLGMTDVS